uniref:Uncharacterized protein n=1 Tax=Vitis vinifera TaxID=29760 RepID=F6HA05_VITVI
MLMHGKRLTLCLISFTKLHFVYKKPHNSKEILRV